MLCYHHLSVYLHLYFDIVVAYFYVKDNIPLVNQMFLCCDY